MRVVAGSARGRVLASPEGMDTRPTADRLKEALFSMLYDYTRGAAFLDLFAGTGQIGIEALSRGADSAVFVEKDKRCADIIRANLTRAKLSDKGRVICGDCLETLTGLKREGAVFDVVFLDPPYGVGLAEQTLQAVISCGVLKPDGLAVAEQAAREAPPSVAGLAVEKIKSYKTTSFIFMRHESGLTEVDA